MNAAKLIDNQIADLADWRGKVLKQLRTLIHEADPRIEEEWKWNSAVFVHQGMVCSLGCFKDHVKINFFKGATLKDQSLFNAGRDAKTSRGIDLHEGDRINEAPLKRLIQSAVVLNEVEHKP